MKERGTSQDLFLFEVYRTWSYVVVIVDTGTPLLLATETQVDSCLASKSLLTCGTNRSINMYGTTNSIYLF